MGELHAHRRPVRGQRRGGPAVDSTIMLGLERRLDKYTL